MNYTRKQYLNRECTHREYYAQFVTEETKKIISHQIGLNNISKSTHESFNDIPLDTWDSLPQLPQSTYRKMESLGDCITIAGNVCVYKEAAKQIKNEHIEAINKDIKQPEND